jgi:xanthine dehydrogenase accessory factor
VPVAKVTVIAGAEGVLGSELLVFEDGANLGSLEGPAAEDGLKAGMEVLVSGRAHAVTASGIVDLLVEGYPPSPELVIVGGVHISLALVKLARIMGFRTVVIDPRRAFGSTNRFPDVDRLIQAWPSVAFQEVNLTPSTAVVMLTHDPKIDDPAFAAALSSPAFFIGALGSHKTHASRRSRLEAAGIDVEQIARIYGPVGLDIGGQNPEEIALAIMAQIIAARNQRLMVSNRSGESGS